MIPIKISAVISAALVDAINPCAFAVLIILLTTILASSRKKVIFAGFAFTIAIYISYLLMGLGLYTAIQATKVIRVFYIFVIFLAITIGILNIKDYFKYGAFGFVLEVPRKWRPALKKIISGVTSVPGAAIIGFIVSLFLLPCTSGPYIVILGMLAASTTRNIALYLLLLYNFIFILPMIFITIAVYFGIATTEKVEEWRKEKIKILHLIAGVIMIALGFGLAIALKFNLI